MQGWLIRLSLVVLSSLQPIHAFGFVAFPAVGRRGMVVTNQVLASEVGVEALRQGANAIDAAIAVAFALAVVEPSAGNIGGGGFMLIRTADGSVNSIDYRERAPLLTHAKSYLDVQGVLPNDANHLGYKAVATPGTVAGLALAHRLYGSKPWAQLIAPAIRLARQGFRVSPAFADDLAHYANELQKYPSSKGVFLKSTGEPYQPDDLFRQTDLANTLDRLARQGVNGFYRGKTAQLMIQAMIANSGWLRENDLTSYQPMVRMPTRGTYRGYTIYSIPPPSSGGVTLQLMLNMLEAENLSKLGPNSAAYIHRLVETMRRAFALRAHYLGDPEQVSGMPLSTLLSKPFASRLIRDIRSRKATRSHPDDVPWHAEPMETTHFSIVDRLGNAVSNTYTIEQHYGSKIVVPGAGFLLNNEMGDFNPVPNLTTTSGQIGSSPNLIGPGKRPLSSMTPTIVTYQDRLFLVLGSPGGRTIINTVLETLLNIIDFQMPLPEAVAAPRFHHQWLPDEIVMEPYGFSPDTTDKLKQMGHRITFLSPDSPMQGRVMAIQIDPNTRKRLGFADLRGADSKAVGY